MTTTTKDETMPVTDALRARVAAAGAALADANTARDTAVAAARKVTVAAHKAGMSEVELAALLGVDRARTVRRWLGKTV